MKVVQLDTFFILYVPIPTVRNTNMADMKTREAGATVFVSVWRPAVTNKSKEQGTRNFGRRRTVNVITYIHARFSPSEQLQTSRHREMLGSYVKNVL